VIACLLAQWPHCDDPKFKVADALKIATFPTLLLLTTLYRLAIEVAATRHPPARRRRRRHPGLRARRGGRQPGGGRGGVPQ
jgi:hypothetical protein